MNRVGSPPIDAVVVRPSVADGLRVLRLRTSNPFTRVYEAVWCGERVALKQVAPHAPRDVVDEFVRECATLQSLPRHAGVVHALLVCGAHSDDNGAAAAAPPPEGEAMRTLRAATPPPAQAWPLQRFLLEELADFSLHELIYDMHVPLTLAAQLKIARDVCAGLQHLHGQTPPLVHRDIKSGNVLVFARSPSPSSSPASREDGAVRASRPPHSRTDSDFFVHAAKLCDFGLARTQSDTGRMTVFRGTHGWMAPEVMGLGADALSEYTAKCDVFSFGMLLYELFTFTSPFADAQHAVDVCHRVLEGARPTLDVEPHAVPVAVRDIIARCWLSDPERRPSVRELCDALARVPELANNGAQVPGAAMAAMAAACSSSGCSIGVRSPTLSPGQLRRRLAPDAASPFVAHTHAGEPSSAAVSACPSQAVSRSHSQLLAHTPSDQSRGLKRPMTASPGPEPFSLSLALSAASDVDTGGAVLVPYTLASCGTGMAFEALAALPAAANGDGAASELHARAGLSPCAAQTPHSPDCGVGDARLRVSSLGGAAGVEARGASGGVSFGADCARSPARYAPHSAATPRGERASPEVTERRAQRRRLQAAVDDDDVEARA